MGIANHRALRSVGMATCLVFVLVVGLACSPAGESSNWMMNGFLDPSQVGQFRGEKRNEVRNVISILEEPMGIPNTEEPTPDDNIARFDETRIAPGDAVNITIFELMAAGQASETQVRVGNSGYETIPGIGRVRLIGFTPRELESEIKQFLKAQDILADADVQVTLLDVRSLQYSILGSVQRAGSFALPRPDYRLLQALADAGGISPLIEKVYVFRKEAPVPAEAGPAGAPGAPAQGAIAPMTYHLSDVGRPGGGLPFRASPSANSEGQDVPTSSPSESTLPGEGGLPMGSEPEPDLPGLAGESPTSAPDSTPASAPTSSQANEPATAPSTVDEMEILEGRTGTSQPSITWDPARGGWVIEGAPADAMPGSDPATPSQPGGPPPQAPGVFDSATTDRTRIIEIPAKELLEGDSRYNIVIRPNDVIQILPGAVGEYYLQGNVLRPGAYGMNGRRPTLKEAIASAGGFGALAWPSRVDLIRRVSQDEEQIIQVNLDAIYAGEAPDLYLKPNDLVNVGSSPAAVFLAVLRNAFRFTYGFGFVYDRNFADADSFGARESVKTRRLQEAQIRGLPSN